MRTSLLLPALAVAAALACAGPLYEDVGQVRSWVVCCDAHSVSTCACSDPEGCLPDLRPCAGGACVTPASASCSQLHPSDGGSSGGGGDGGGPVQTDGGTAATDGGTAATDGGVLSDAGTPGGEDAGTPTEYELCCRSGSVSTCECAASGCDAPAFTACVGGTCVLSGDCP